MKTWLVIIIVTCTFLNFLGNHYKLAGNYDGQSAAVITLVSNEVKQ